MVQTAFPEHLQVCNRSRGKGSSWSFVLVTVLGGNPGRGQLESHFPSYLFQPSSTFQHPLPLADGTSSDLNHPQMRCSPEERSKAGKSPTSRSHGLTAGPTEGGQKPQGLESCGGGRPRVVLPPGCHERAVLWRQSGSAEDPSQPEWRFSGNRKNPPRGRGKVTSAAFTSSRSDTQALHFSIPPRPLAVLAWLFWTSAFRFMPSRAARGKTDSFYFYYYSLIQSLIQEKQQEPTCKAIKVIGGSRGITNSSPPVSNCALTTATQMHL